MRVDVVLQTEANECGLACLAMVARAHGLLLDLPDIRRRFPTSARGVGLQNIIGQAASLGFAARPLRLDLEELSSLKTPCILHWDLNHYVILVKCKYRGVEIIDPAIGRRKISEAEISKSFTGVALELSPNANFQPNRDLPRLPLKALTGKVLGLKRSMLQIICVAFALEVFAITAPLLNQIVVDDVLGSGDHDLLAVLVVGFGILLVAQALIGLARSWMVVVLGQTLSLQWRGNVFSHLIKLPVNYFEKRHLGDITSRFSSINAIQQTLTGAVIESVLDGIMAIAVMIMMVVYSPALAVIVFCAVALYALLRYISFGALRKAASERLIVAARESTHFIETLRAMAPIKLFGREQQRRAQWQNLLVEIQNRDVYTSRLTIGFSAAQTLIFGIENLLVIWVAAKLMLESSTGNASGAMTVGMLFAFLGYRAQFVSKVPKLIDNFFSFRMLEMHMARLADIALEPPELENGLNSDLTHLKASLEFRNVSFRYGHGEPWILKNVSFRVEEGDNLAIVGPSGSGKTTLLKIALGLLEPTVGDVLFGDVPTRQIGLQNFRRHVGTVMQDDSLLSGTLAENISFFDPSATPELIHECAQKAHIHEDIIKMPMGYETVIGDLGIGVSGGQKQRLLLARAIYKKPRVLALDEATSHLDVKTEKAVTAQISEMQVTKIVIAHRPETIASAKRVMMLKDGALKEQPKKILNAEKELMGV